MIMEEDLKLPKLLIPASQSCQYKPKLQIYHVLSLPGYRRFACA
jgi:hypothetical protein